MIAVTRGYADIIGDLVNLGQASVNVTYNGRSAITIARSKGYLNLVEFLERAYLDPVVICPEHERIAKSNSSSSKHSSVQKPLNIAITESLRPKTPPIPTMRASWSLSSKSRSAATTDMNHDDVPRSVTTTRGKNKTDSDHAYDGRELPEMTYKDVDIPGVGIISVASMSSLEVDLNHQDLQDDSETEPQKEVDTKAEIAY